MADLAAVLHHVNAGKKIQIYTDIYGAWRVEYRTGWLLRRTVRVELESADVAKVKEALRKRRGAHAKSGSASENQ
jgi:hypothetical protein